MEKPDWWTEQNDFFGEFYMQGDDSREGYLSAEARSLAERTKTEVDGVLTLLNLNSRPRLILDLPCGYGRHSIALAKHGHLVVGSDINSIHLCRARAEAGKQGVAVDFRQENMLEIDYEKKFDIVINMFYSFGFFETDEENMEVLRRIYVALQPGGQFLMHTDVNIPRIIAGKYKQDEIRTLSSGNRLRVIDYFNPETKRIEGVWIISNSAGKEVRKDYSVRVYEKDEFVQMCLDVGFGRCETYGGWKEEAYSENSEEVMFVATK